MTDHPRAMRAAPAAGNSHLGITLGLARSRRCEPNHNGGPCLTASRPVRPGLAPPFHAASALPSLFKPCRAALG
jgi:hypothetical protein